MIAKKVEPIMFAMASGYVMKSKLGPGKLENNIYGEVRVRIRLLFLSFSFHSFFPH